MKGWQKNYPPYEGSEPYLYLAFADADSRKVWPVMKSLLKRGCRVWYCTGPAGNSRELLRRQERSSGAAWTLLFLTDALTADKESKSRIMVNQKDHKPITGLDTDGTSRYLAMDLRESTPMLPLYRCKREAQLDEALIRAEGYTQNIIGKPVRIRNRWLGRLTGTFLLLAVLLTGSCIFFSQREIAYEDTVVFADPVIREAARAAAGGGALTPEQLQNIQSLRLTETPESWQDLCMLPGLLQIEMTQQAAAGAKELPLDGYRIVLYGGVS